MEQEEYDKITHSWDNYQLSEEVISMAPKKRKKVYGDYNTELTSGTSIQALHAFMCLKNVCK